MDAQDRLLSDGGATYAYTAQGDLRLKVEGADTTRYTYDALGNLTQVRLPDGTAIVYLLDPQNRRIGRTVNGVLERAWLYQGQLTPVAELDGAGQVVSRFVYATGVNVPDYLVKGDSTYRLVRDHLGSVRLVVNVASGAVAQRVSYDEFGIETENTAPGWQPFGYAGGLTDAATGLLRFGARDYDPVAGRWTAKDPIGFAGGALSLYEYAAQDPVNFVDPSGEAIPLVIAIPFIAGVGTGIISMIADVLRCTSTEQSVRRAGVVGFTAGFLASYSGIYAGLGLAAAGASTFWAATGGSLVGGAIGTASEDAANGVFSPARIGEGAVVSAFAGGAATKFRPLVGRHPFMTSDRRLNWNVGRNSERLFSQEAAATIITGVAPSPVLSSPLRADP